FPVGVGGDQHAARRLGGFLDLGEGLCLFLDGDVFGGEAVLDVHAELALRQVAHVPHGRLDRVARAQVLADRLGLGGGFDDDERTFAPGPRPGVSRAGTFRPPRGAATGSAVAGTFRRLRTFTSFTSFTSAFLAATRQPFVKTARERIFTIPHSIAQA